MIIFNPHNPEKIKKRLTEIEELLNQLPTKHCFITGSFLDKERYKDIDIFVISRSKKIRLHNKKAKITTLDFNDLHSLFYHSLCGSYVSKNILPTKPLKVTLSDYWHVVNEAIPTILNNKDKFHKDIRFLVLYTEYFLSGKILDTFGLRKKISQFKSHEELLNHVKENVPKIMLKKAKKSYIKRFFYTQAGYYKDSLDYKAQRYLYNLTHSITKG